MVSVRMRADDARAAGINVPIFPGIMPLNAYGGFKRMTGFCKTRIPPAMAERMATCNGDSDEQKKAKKDSEEAAEEKARKAALDRRTA